MLPSKAWGVVGVAVSTNLTSQLSSPTEYKYNSLGVIQRICGIKSLGSDWSAKKLVISLDNSASVSNINSGFTRDPLLATIARNIWFEGSVNDIQIWATHVPGIKNQVADLLSRWETYVDPMAMLTKFIPQPKWFLVQMPHLTLIQEI